jgi:hypothetical protein
MTQAVREKIKIYIEKIKLAMVGIGFSEVEAEGQLRDLGEIIVLAITKKIIDHHFPNQLPTSKQLEEAVKAKYTEKDLAKLISEQSVPIISEYFEEITVSISPEQQQKFYQHISK